MCAKIHLKVSPLYVGPAVCILWSVLNHFLEDVHLFCEFVHVTMLVSMDTCVHVRVFVCMDTCACVCVRMCACVCVCFGICMYVCVHIYLSLSNIHPLLEVKNVRVLVPTRSLGQ